MNNFKGTNQLKNPNKSFKAILVEALVGRGIEKLVAMLLPFVAVKLYGAEAYGEFAYYLAIIMTLSTLAILGLDNGLIYFIPKINEKYVSGAFLIVTILTFILGAIYTLFDFKFIIYTPFLFLLVMQKLFFALHRSYDTIKQYYVINNFLNHIIVVILLFILTKSSFEQIIVLSFTIGYLLSVVILFFYNVGRFQKITFSKSLILYSLPLMLTAGMGVIMNQVDVIMLRNYLDDTSVGIYSIASKLAILPATLLTIFNIVFAPRVSRLFNEGKVNELKNLYYKSARILMVVSGIIIVFILLLKNIILGFFGEDFLIADKVLLYRGIGQFINCSVGSVWILISMSGRSKLNMIGTMLAAIINVTLNFLLIPRLGLDGAAIASMIAVSFTNIFGYLLIKKIYGIKLFKII